MAGSSQRSPFAKSLPRAASRHIQPVTSPAFRKSYWERPRSNRASCSHRETLSSTRRTRIVAYRNRLSAWRSFDPAFGSDLPLGHDCLVGSVSLRRIVKFRGAEREGIMSIQVGVHPGEQFNGINRFGRRRLELAGTAGGRFHDVRVIILAIVDVVVHVVIDDSGNSSPNRPLPRRNRSWRKKTFAWIRSLTATCVACSNAGPRSSLRARD